MKMYLDDIRIPSDPSFIIVRSFSEAVSFVMKNGVPSFISFDHDLGMKDGELLETGYDFAKWLVENDLNGVIKIPEDFSFNVHSANPVGAKNIESYINNYIKFKKENK